MLWFKYFSSISEIPIFQNGTGKTGAYSVPLLEQIDTTKDVIQVRESAAKHRHYQLIIIT